MVCKINLIIALSFCIANYNFSQVHFTFTALTGNNATIAVPVISNPNITGTPLSSGDEIGVFTPDGLCVGAVVWNNANVAITIWGDNPQTQVIDGIRPGEEMKFRVWQSSTNTEYDSVIVVYSQGSGTYTSNGVYILSGLTAHSSITSFQDESIEYIPRNINISTSVYPNPFNASTRYRIESQISSVVDIDVVDLLGRKLLRLADTEILEGKNDIDISLQNFASGIYFIITTIIRNNTDDSQLKNNKHIFSNKIILLN